MNKYHFIKPSIIVCVISLTLSACNSSSNKSSINGNNSQEESLEFNSLGISSSIPSSLSSTYTSKLKFDRYSKVDTPNGGKIHLVAQDEVTNNQIVRARKVLEHFLTDYPDSIYGSDKSVVANKMSENGATLLLLNGSDDGTNEGSNLDGQALFADEIQVEGHSWYVNQNYAHRDATYEEILHLVHDYGIGVDQNETFIGALPDFQSEIRAAQISAQSSNLWAWTEEFAEWVQEITQENSLSQEYLASVIDSYYGLWGAFEGEYGMWGGYIAKTRDDIFIKDTEGGELLNKKFFHPYLTYNARIDESFKGTFSLKYDSQLVYTNHSQYLKDITLTGENDSNVVVNGFDNNITGNSGTNKVVFSGQASEYQYERKDEKIEVIDFQDNRDGINLLEGIEYLEFSDVTVNVSDI